MSESTTQFTFVGESTSATKEARVQWAKHPDVCAAVVKAKLLDKKSSKEAFEVGRLMLVEQGALQPDETLPESYTNHNAGSLWDSHKKRFLNRINKGDKASIEAAQSIGLIQKVEEPKEEVVETIES